RDVDAVSRRRLTICRDGDLAQRRPVVDLHLVGARHGLEYVSNVLADAAQFIKFLAENLYRELAMRLENLVLDTIQDGLAEGEFVAWELRKPCPHATDKILLGFTRWPRVVRVEHDECFHMGGGVRIGAVIIATNMVHNR